MKKRLREGGEGLNPCFSGICAASGGKITKSSLKFGGLNPCFSGICAARGKNFSRYYCGVKVLILVLVEYAPREKKSLPLTLQLCGLNPCFSGICAASKNRGWPVRDPSQGLNPCFSGICAASSLPIYAKYRSRKQVLILVLVEYAPRVRDPSQECGAGLCLNPCFSGICAARLRR